MAKYLGCILRYIIWDNEASAVEDPAICAHVVLRLSSDPMPVCGAGGFNCLYLPYCEALGIWRLWGGACCRFGQTEAWNAGIVISEIRILGGRAALWTRRIREVAVNHWYALHPRRELYAATQSVAKYAINQ